MQRSIDLGSITPVRPKANPRESNTVPISFRVPRELKARAYMIEGLPSILTQLLAQYVEHWETENLEWEEVEE